MMYLIYKYQSLIEAQEVYIALLECENSLLDDKIRHSS